MEFVKLLGPLGVTMPSHASLYAHAPASSFSSASHELDGYSAPAADRCQAPRNYYVHGAEPRFELSRVVRRLLRVPVSHNRSLTAKLFGASVVFSFAESFSVQPAGRRCRPRRLRLRRR